MSHYQQLTYEQRCQIEALKKSGMTQQCIADTLGTSQSTVSRELKRNTGRRGYRHKQAQRLSNERRIQATKTVKMTPAMIERVEEKLSEKWSPEQISGWLRETYGESPSHERIYQHIWEDKRCGGELYLCLRRQGKKYQKRCQGKTSRGRIRNRVGIEQRPAVVEGTSRVATTTTTTTATDARAAVDVASATGGAVVNVAATAATPSPSCVRTTSSSPSQAFSTCSTTMRSSAPRVTSRDQTTSTCR